MSIPQEPSPKSPERPPPKAKLFQTLAVEHAPEFRRLCLAVLCERWAAFMLISTVAVMLCERFGFSRPDALRLWSLISAASYVGSLPGGQLLDRTRAPSRGIGIAALTLLLGYIALSIPLRASLYVALAFLVIGHSLFKPSAQRIIAAIYPTGDRRLERAQILLYFTANIGAAAGSLLAGLLARFAGWSVTYASAALLMSLGVVLLLRMDPRPMEPLLSTGTHDCIHTKQRTLSIPNHGPIIGGLTIAMFLFSLCTTQMEGAILLWATDRIDLVLVGYSIPTAWFLAFPAVLVLLLTPIQLGSLPKLKEWFGLSRLIAMGLLAAAASFAVLLPTTLWSSRVSIAWLALSLFCFVVAELLIAPLGLSLLLRCIPKRFVGTVTGLWYGAGALGYYVGGEIGALWSHWPTQRVLLLLSLLPLCGTALLWRVRTPQDS
jgi:POT family proton-dependent oligopeptide transporter